MKPTIYEKDHQQATCEREGKSKDIYRGESFISPKVSERYFEIIVEHVRTIYDL